MIVILSNDVHHAELVVNGTVVQRAGRDFNIGIQPFGHGASALRLSDLSSHDRIEIRETGSGQAPVIVANVDRVATAYDSGLGSGVFYGILVTIVLFHIVMAVGMRDATSLWFVAWVTAVIGIELDRDNLLPLGVADTDRALLAINIAAQFAIVGFFAAYLRLRRQAPLLFWALLLTNIATTALSPLVGAITHRHVSLTVIFIENTVSIGVAISVALLRRRAGYRPASFLAFGFLGTLLIFVSRLFRDFTGIESPFFDRWSIEFGSVFNYLVFTLGIIYRGRFTHRESEVIEAELREASLVAGQDPLTGLLNRRGLDDWMNAVQTATGTVLFIDIDGFKAINDEGGHAAGDDILTVIARIIHHSVRAQDAVARFGGDEFVVILAGSNDPSMTADVVSRISSAVALILPLGANSDTRIGVSIGSAMITDRTPYREALQNADADAYRVKAEHHAVMRNLGTRLSAI